MEKSVSLIQFQWDFKILISSEKFLRTTRWCVVLKNSAESCFLTVFESFSLY